ncbi:MAG TPA: lytic transglycosylase domain-containing protein [Chitinophagaceae bacterium]|nr:lytic transglycosylase domain-containing protein [Chitinophagaceae bacterium]
MFTNKLAKKGLIRNGLLFLIALVSVAATREISDMSQRSSTDTTQLRFDTLLLKLNGASETDMLNAPAISMNMHAVSYVNSYTTENSELLEKIRDKSGKYFKIADDIFSKYGLPQELKYLAVVESELKMTALSKVGARGPWQLMPETARLLSLKVTKKYDERTHYYKSTIAAAKYMRDLHAIFGDWLLVIASYNSGPGKVFQAIKKSGSRNFWKLQNYLPAETRGHVKKFVATHYFFEGKGSVTTLTREEAISYKKLMKEFVAKHNALLDETQPGIEIVASDALIKGQIAKRTTNNSVIE